MARVDYDGDVGRNFDLGRPLLPETAEAWQTAVRPLRPESPFPALDLGSGTGRFSGLLAESFDRPVVGVEPAATMREAARARTGANVWFVGGAAERIPLRKSSCSIAWLSNVVHHFDDLAATGRELRRVLRLACRVLIRGWFPDVSVSLSYWELFPTAAKVARSFPTVEEIAAAFAPAGFSVELTRRVDQVIAHDLDELVARVKVRADSTLAPVPDDEFEAGVAELERLAREEPPAPVHDPLDLVVLR